MRTLNFWEALIQFEAFLLKYEKLGANNFTMNKCVFYIKKKLSICNIKCSHLFFNHNMFLLEELAVFLKFYILGKLRVFSVS